jgi:hypothetical protein
LSFVLDIENIFIIKERNKKQEHLQDLTTVELHSKENFAFVKLQASLSFVLDLENFSSKEAISYKVIKKSKTLCWFVSPRTGSNLDQDHFSRAV